RGRGAARPPEGAALRATKRRLDSEVSVGDCIALVTQTSRSRHRWRGAGAPLDERRGDRCRERGTVVPYRLLLIFSLLFPIFAAGEPAHGALSPDQQKCQADVARRAGIYFTAAAKALRRCEELIAKGTLPPATDCELESVTAGKLAKAEGKLQTIAKRCDDATVASLSFGDDCYGASSVAELVACQADVHREQALRSVETVFDSAGPTAGAARACQKMTARQAQNFVRKAHKEIRGCKDDVSSGDL